MNSQADDTDDLRLFHTAEHPCGYWPERLARDLVFDPGDPRLPNVFPMALRWGFRRSGNLIYRPHCRDCHACVAVRIPVMAFTPDRAQRRCLRRNADIETRVLPSVRTDEQFALYRRYLAARHPGGGMDGHGAAEFDQFLVSAWGQGRFLEFRRRAAHGTGELLAVAVTDVVDDALSAVYTFYDPDEAARGLGTYAILRQIEWARREGRQYLYLGYWIDGHRKMAYKTRYQPIEAHDGRAWAPMSPPPPPSASGPDPSQDAIDP